MNDLATAWNARPFLGEGDLFLSAYRVHREIGRGGMGAVYEVIDELGTQHRFALKVLDPRVASHAEFRERFATEARITANVSSIHVAKVLRTGVDSETGLSYILMELIQGTDLGGRIRPGRGLAPEYALMLLRQAAAALDILHRHGIVHRDLKPANLVVALTDDLVPILKIVDFGIAKCVAAHGAAVTTAGVGTVPYQAPEQMVGDRQIGPSADRYALAQVAFTLLTGQPYWLADRGDHWTAAKIFQTMKLRACMTANARIQQLNQYLRELGGHGRGQMPAEFDAWFTKATAFSPEERFPSAREMIDELARSLEPVLCNHDADTFAINASASVASLSQHIGSGLDSSEGGRISQRNSVGAGASPIHPSNTLPESLQPMSASTLTSAGRWSKPSTSYAALGALAIAGGLGWWIVGETRRGAIHEPNPAFAENLHNLAQVTSSAVNATADLVDAGLGNAGLGNAGLGNAGLGNAKRPQDTTIAPASPGSTATRATSPRATSANPNNSNAAPANSVAAGGNAPRSEATTQSMSRGVTPDPPDRGFR